MRALPRFPTQRGLGHEDTSAESEEAAPVSVTCPRPMPSSEPHAMRYAFVARRRHTESISAVRRGTLPPPSPDFVAKKDDNEN